MDQERWYVRNEQGDFYAGFGRWVDINHLRIAESFTENEAISVARYFSRNRPPSQRSTFQAVKL